MSTRAIEFLINVQSNKCKVVHVESTNSYLCCFIRDTCILLECISSFDCTGQINPISTHHFVAFLHKLYTSIPVPLFLFSRILHPSTRMFLDSSIVSYCSYVCLLIFTSYVHILSYDKIVSCLLYELQDFIFYPPFFDKIKLCCVVHKPQTSTWTSETTRRMPSLRMNCTSDSQFPKV